MNNTKLIKELKHSYLVRCKFWGICSQTDCDHYAKHNAGRSCKYKSPVKFCKIIGGFVYDIALSGSDSDYECDPNLAFKARRERAQSADQMPWKTSMR